MLNYIIPLLSSWLGSMAEYVFFPVFCLAFIATVPCIIRAFLR